MEKKPRHGRGYLYRTFRKMRFLLQRGSFFRTPAAQTKSLRRDHTIPTVSFVLISINSLFLFLFSYIVIFLLYGFATSLASNAFNIPTVIYLDELSFLIKGIGWSSDAVKVVYSAGPLASLLAGIIFIILYQHVAEENGIARLLVIWLFAQCCVFFFGEVMMGSLFGRGFGYVLMYLYAKDTVMMVITVIALLLMIVVGFRFARSFVISANIWFNELPSFYLKKFLVYQFLIPFILGNIAIILIKLPTISPFGIATNLTMLFLLVPVLIQGVRFEDFYYDEEPRKVHLSFAWIMATLLLAVAFRLFVGPGLKLIF